MEKPAITFDAEGRVRVLEADKFTATVELQQEAKAFAEKVTEFSTTVHGIVESLGEHSAKIEAAKLRAIGQRILVESERDSRESARASLRARIQECAVVQERLAAELEALARVEAEQRELLEKLASNESGGV